MLYSRGGVCRIVFMTRFVTSPPENPVPVRQSTVDKVLRIGFCLLVAGLLAFSLVRAIGATIQTQWPPEWDVLRDFGTAQVILEGRYPEDPILVGKTLWYNPLTGAILALAHLVSGLPVARLGILLGPYLNLVTPLGFVVLLALLFGRPAALAGMCLVLFGKNPANPFWVQLCYAPWLMAPLYASGLMFLTLAVFYRAFSRGSTTGHVFAGGLLGITFMAHTAPAIVAGGTMLLFCIVQALFPGCTSSLPAKDAAFGDGKNRRAAFQLLGRFLLLLLAAFVISLPYTWSILWKYGFHVRNPYPSLFAVDYVLLDQLPARLHEALNWRNGFAVLGLGVLSYRRDMPSRLVLCWTVTAALLMVQHYGVQALAEWNNVLLPGFAPGHHWAIHWSAARAALFAVGVAAAGAGAVFLLGHILPAVSDAFLMKACRAGASAAACLAGGFLYVSHPLTTRADFQEPDMAGYRQFHEQYIPVYEWVLNNTPPESVFLCRDDSVAMTVVMPAARKLLFPMLIYSNPFVDIGPLAQENGKVYDAIKQGDRDAFCAEAARYAGLYMLLKEQEAASPENNPVPFFAEVYRSGGLVVLKAMSCD